jgi:RsiW-degrading membrane proteinase PrsW (M82 family)
MSILALLIATAVPLVVLYIIYTLDLYGTGAFRSIALCFGWGAVAVGLAYYANTTVYNVSLLAYANPTHLEQQAVYTNVTRYMAPVIEEILKAVVLIYLVRRPNFTYFVDGAIYGFAVGIGFAVFENYFYLFTTPGEEIGTAVSRVISTNLMHATASATVGITLGFARFQRFSGRALFLLGGLLLAIVIHAAYNNLVTRAGGGLLLLYAGGAGVGGALAIGFTIKRGLAEQKKWIEETLGAADRVTRSEAAVVNRLADAHTILAPLAEIFGAEKADQIENFLVLQARLGIMRKTVQKLNDDKMRAAVEKQMDDIRGQMDQARRAVGAYTMLHLRSIFPEEGSPIWGRLAFVIEERAAAPKPAGGSALWGKLEARVRVPDTAVEQDPPPAQAD